MGIVWSDDGFSDVWCGYEEVEEDVMMVVRKGRVVRV